MRDLFYNWMIDVEGKKPSTAYSYKNAVNKISEHYSQQTRNYTDIYAIEDKEHLEDIKADYSTTGRFASYGYEGNGTIRNAIATYVRFFHHFSQNGVTTQTPQQNAVNPFIRQNNTGKTRSYSNTAPTTNKRYKGNAIGNSQNLLIRNILSNIGNETFTQADWIETKKYFSNKCAYCGSADKRLVMEHAIPINKQELGEHRLGNLVPSCQECNNNKHYADFKEFLTDKPQQLAKILEYMRDNNYIALKDNSNSEVITDLLNMAHEEIGQIAQRYISIINKLL